MVRDPTKKVKATKKLTGKATADQDNPRHSYKPSKRAADIASHLIKEARKRDQP